MHSFSKYSLNMSRNLTLFSHRSLNSSEMLKNYGKFFNSDQYIISHFGYEYESNGLHFHSFLCGKISEHFVTNYISI